LTTIKAWKLLYRVFVTENSKKRSIKRGKTEQEREGKEKKENQRGWKKKQQKTGA